MHLNDYQKLAQETDQAVKRSGDGLVIPLLGLAGEVGTLLTAHKKLLRDGSAYALYGDQVAEELGDILWYVANVATKFGLTLSHVAELNLQKTQSRWRSDLVPTTHTNFADEKFPENEQLPRSFEVRFSHEEIGSKRFVVLTLDGLPVGDPVRDNAYADDGYRFHDVFHLSFAALLGWSPVLRRLLGRKRKSAPEIDEVEDGGRAAAIEEGIVALVYSYAEAHDFLRDVSTIDYDLLRTVRTMVAHLEPRSRTVREWEYAILCGFRTWNNLRTHDGGIVSGNLLTKELSYRAS